MPKDYDVSLQRETELLAILLISSDCLKNEMQRTVSMTFHMNHLRITVQHIHVGLYGPCTLVASGFCRIVYTRIAIRRLTFDSTNIMLIRSRCICS